MTARSSTRFNDVLRRCRAARVGLLGERRTRVEKSNLVKHGGVLLQLHSLENGASRPRSPSDPTLDTVVLHYTACADLPRRCSAQTAERLIRRALRLKHVEAGEAENMIRAVRNMQGDEVPDSIAQAAISCYSEREAIAHYFVASTTAIVHVPVFAPPVPDFVNQGIRNDDVVVPVVETVGIDRVAHHVGPLTGNTNRRSVGIEVCYPGPAPRKTCRTESQAREWFRARGWNVPDLWWRLVCLDGVSRWFAPLPYCTFNAVVGLVADLCLRIPTIRYICPHWTFAPTKRIDCDPPLSVKAVTSEVAVITGRRLDNSKPPR